MKKLILLLSITCTLGLNAQTYYPFPADNSIWHTVGVNIFTWGEYVFNLALDGDTTINSITYSKIYRLADTAFNDPASEYIGALRENTNKQVMLQLPGMPEFKLYDFNMNVGDTIWYPMGGSLCGNGYVLELRSHYKTVTSKSTILLNNGQTRTTWKLEGEIVDDLWVEGIGSISWFGLLNPLISDLTLCGDNYYFGCFKELDQVVFIDETVCNPCLSDYIMAVPDPGQKIEDIEVICNNPGKSITVSVKNNPGNLQLTILNETGQKITSNALKGEGQTTISTSAFAKGLYIYTVTGNSGKSHTGKFMIL
jgi:hypothetical protein